MIHQARNRNSRNYGRIIVKPRAGRCGDSIFMTVECVDGAGCHVEEYTALPGGGLATPTYRPPVARAGVRTIKTTGVSTITQRNELCRRLSQNIPIIVCGVVGNLGKPTQSKR